MDDGSGTFLLIGVIFLAVGLPMVLIAIYLIFRTRRFLRTAVSTTGVIVDLIASSGSEGGTVYQAVVDFQTADGRTVRWTESMASSPAAGQPGEQIPMKYNPDNPEEARINRTFRMWFLPGLLIFLGVVFGGLGALFTILGLL
jgi:Protein of unknown function (DUF3592)